MARAERHEADREDLFAELRTSSPRWELDVEEESNFVVAGIRPDGRFSVYFGPSPCYHFDSQHRLLRAYAHENLYRTQGDTLARLRRERSETETVLLRNDLTSTELTAFLQEMTDRLQCLHRNLLAQRFSVMRMEDCQDNGIQQLIERIAGCLEAPVRLAPPFSGRR